MEEKIQNSQVNTNEYAFVSYSHQDSLQVEEIISSLKRMACNIWYDKGIENGSDWTEFIANQLDKATCVIWFITNNSIKSDYVLNEINFATTRKKKIIPVYLEEVILPLGVELLLGKIQAIHKADLPLSKVRELIVKALPVEVFYKASIPFFFNENKVFFLNDLSTEFPDGTYFAGETNYKYSVGFCDASVSENQTTLFEIKTIPAYDLLLKITNVTSVNDKYIPELNASSVILNLSLSFMAKYPVPAPDYDACLVFAIYNANETPKYKLLESKILHVEVYGDRDYNEGVKFVQNNFSDIIKKLN